MMVPGSFCGSNPTIFLLLICHMVRLILYVLKVQDYVRVFLTNLLMPLSWTLCTFTLLSHFYFLQLSSSWSPIFVFNRLLTATVRHQVCWAHFHVLQSVCLEHSTRGLLCCLWSWTVQRTTENTFFSLWRLMSVAGVNACVMHLCPITVIDAVARYKSYSNDDDDILQVHVAATDDCWEESWDKSKDVWREN